MSSDAKTSARFPEVFVPSLAALTWFNTSALRFSSDRGRIVDEVLAWLSRRDNGRSSSLCWWLVSAPKSTGSEYPLDKIERYCLDLNAQGKTRPMLESKTWMYYVERESTLN